MLRDSFCDLLADGSAPEDPLVWESSRFALDLPLSAPKQAGIAIGIYELFTGMVEFGFLRGLRSLVTVTDLHIGRILSGRLATRSDPQRIEHARHCRISRRLHRELGSLLRNAGIKGPVPWTPVMKIA
ncbi:acyl-homoserine-lactone synthase [Mesorhizobium sp. M0615]|uniref:acyl-homoserine-lactone synthase n=1 Tax=Mesorhizobium sp. M0615 TaxID=2956971 RepID=UPI00333AD429